jgi:NADH:ubiquinone oxidoreductase subunit F (NADH-binding)/(2Fe-2S) ferredoxin/NAD-dependent dihydropyrimidine dehydrogenase PreA subunit
MEPNKNSVKQRTILICQGTGCTAGKSDALTAALKKAVEEQGLKDVKVDFTGCQEFCEQGPVAIVEPEGIFYVHITPADVPEIVSSLRDGKPVERLYYTDPLTNKPVPLYKDITFNKLQERIILRNCGRINPERIEDSIAVGGYEGLRKALTMTPEQVIAEVKKSGLQGRGGAGFSTATKWELCRANQADQKYMICNADEGDPGAFMDSATMEGDPHTVIEGLMIAAYSIGASKGYIYIRAEYPLAIKRLTIAIKQAEEHGFIGENILGSRFSFQLKLKKGAGAFVCGEETALMASIEGRRGMPRSRPPYPAQYGLHGKPTTINNVKTLATIPAIIHKGADWYASIGTDKNKGTTVFALTGKIVNSGLVEVPLGTKLRTIINDIGGGVPKGKKFKAVQTGGPSGGCIPASFLDSPVDYQTLAAAGSIVGSGGMVVMDEDTCMVDVARYFSSFTQSESCGKCVPCRVGTMQMLQILRRICGGQGKPEDIPALQKLGEDMNKGSLCALGQTAPNPVLTTLRYFMDEYKAHILEHRCPALVCPDLINYYVLPDKCQGCGICARECPHGAITGGKRMIHIIDQAKCAKCGVCIEACPEKFNAIVKVSGQKIEVPDSPIPVK